MTREYVVVRHNEREEVFHCKGIIEALRKFADVVESCREDNVGLYLLKEGWKELNEENIESVYLKYDSDGDGEVYWLVNLEEEDE